MLENMTHNANQAPKKNLVNRIMSSRPMDYLFGTDTQNRKVSRGKRVAQGLGVAGGIAGTGVGIANFMKEADALLSDPDSGGSGGGGGGRGLTPHYGINNFYGSGIVPGGSASAPWIDNSHLIPTEEEEEEEYYNDGYNGTPIIAPRMQADQYQYARSLMTPQYAREYS